MLANIQEHVPAPELEGKGGMYLYDCKISKTKEEEPDNVDAVKMLV